jgi:hypothetical protein
LRSLQRLRSKQLSKLSDQNEIKLSTIPFSASRSLQYCRILNLVYGQQPLLQLSQGGHSGTPKTITAMVLTLYVLQNCKLKTFWCFHLGCYWVTCTRMLVTVETCGRES